MANTAFPVAILILAAGQSSRMRGADKLLEKIDGQLLIRRQVVAALATGLPVWVTLPHDKPLRTAALHGLDCDLVTVPRAALGISQSIRAGNAAIPKSYAVMLLLADLPEITTEDLLKLIAAARQAPDTVVRVTSDARKPGHPVLIPSHLRRELAKLTGDEGARDLLKQHSETTVFVPLPGNRALTDLDTPEDWAAWRDQRKPQS